MFSKIYSTLYFSLAIFSGCSQQIEFAPKGNFSAPGEINPLKGNISSFMQENFVSNTIKGKDSIFSNDTDSICFDEDGNLIYEMIRIPKLFDNERIYKYDKNGVHSYATLMDNDSIIGRLNSISKKILPDKLESITYENGKASKKTVYTYDKNSYIVEKTEFLIHTGKYVFKLHQKLKNRNDGRLTSATFFDSSGKQIGRYDYIYGKHFGPDTIKVKENNGTSIHTYKFDDQGNPLLFLIDGTVQDRYEYEYNALGNWIKRICFRGQKQTSYQIRKYYSKQKQTSIP